MKTETLEWHNLAVSLNDENLICSNCHETIDMNYEGMYGNFVQFEAETILKDGDVFGYTPSGRWRHSSCPSVTLCIHGDLPDFCYLCVDEVS